MYEKCRKWLFWGVSITNLKERFGEYLNVCYFCTRILYSDNSFYQKNDMTLSIKKIFRFYAEGFRGMTWGRTLWWIIGIKLFVMFGILKIFFFQPTLKGSTEEKQTKVATELSKDF